MSRRVGALCAIAYILIQTFQQVAFRVAAEPEDAAGRLLAGPAPLNVARAALLLLSFFAIAYAFLVICAHDFPRHPLASTAAFLGLLAFCFLEIEIRSVELFWVFLRLPHEYALRPEAALASLATFEEVSRALYFPLMFAQLLGSAILALVFPRTPRRNLLIVAAFTINALRLCGRLAGMFLGVSALDAFSGRLYFPLMLGVYAPLAIWLWPTAGAGAEAAPRRQSTR